MYQITRWCTLNLQNIVCSLDLSKDGENMGRKVTAALNTNQSNSHLPIHFISLTMKNKNLIMPATPLIRKTSKVILMLSYNCKRVCLKETCLLLFCRELIDPFHGTDIWDNISQKWFVTCTLCLMWVGGGVVGRMEGMPAPSSCHHPQHTQHNLSQE